MTDEERRQERALALEAYQGAYEDRRSHEARVDRLFQDIGKVLRLYKDGILGSDGAHLTRSGSAGGIPTISGVEYPDPATVARAVSDLREANEREEAAKRRARNAGVNMDALRGI